MTVAVETTPDDNSQSSLAYPAMIDGILDTLNSGLAKERDPATWQSLQKTIASLMIAKDTTQRGSQPSTQTTPAQSLGSDSTTSPSLSVVTAADVKYQCDAKLGRLSTADCENLKYQLPTKGSVRVGPDNPLLLVMSKLATYGVAKMPLDG